MFDRQWATRDTARPLMRGVALLLGMACLSPLAVGQNPAGELPASAPDAWDVPRLRDGRPDLQGIWTNRTITPFERPRELGDQAFFTPEQAEEFMARALERGDRDVRTDDVWDVLWAYNDFWWDGGTELLGNMRTSIVVDPPDGRVPPLTPERRAELAADARAMRERCEEGPGCAVTNSGEVGPAWDPEVLDLMTRCISFGTVVPMLPTAYNNNYQIVQSEGMVAILTEMVHEVRRIPTDGSPHLPSHIRQWFGDSRGYWDGDTLVVETKNFNGQMHGRLRPADENLRVSERFTRIAPNVLLYEFTVDNPGVWTRPWSGEIPMTPADGLLYEYACHEGNRGMENILRAVRMEMAEAGTEEARTD